MKNQHHVITIGRQLGSGGSAMGKAIAEHFGFEYIDKEILVKAAAILDADEENLELVDENVSALTAMARSAAFEMPYIAKEWYIPTSDQLFKTQTEIMRESVEKGPCVIIGRCASYLFRHYEKHTSIFLQADMDSRIKPGQRKSSVLQYLYREKMAGSEAVRSRPGHIAVFRRGDQGYIVPLHHCQIP